MLGYNGGFGLWNDDISGVKNVDCAIIYTIFGNATLLIKSQWRLPRLNFVKFYLFFLLFLIFDMLFSIIHYGLSIFQVVQCTRYYVLFLSFPILAACKKSDLEKILKLLLYICFITSVLYILQILLFRAPIMPYSYGWEFDATTGLPRLYNVPENLILFLTLTFAYPDYYKGKINVNLCRIVFFTALVCTLGRSGIFINLAIIFLTLLFMGLIAKIAKTMIFLFIVLLPFSSIIIDRFSESETSSDMETVITGDFANGYSNGQTLAFRLAWCYERIDYLTNRPIGEQLFGLGLCSESQPWVKRNYNFHIAIPDESTGERTQLLTNDIAYGNMITRLGFGGSIVYILYILALTNYFWRRRHINVFYSFFCSFLLCSFALSITGNMLSEAKTFVIMFLFFSLSNNTMQLSVRHPHNECNLNNGYQFK